MSNKTRLDILLTERGLLDSRQKAQATIMSGIVFVNGQRVDKAGTAVANDAQIEIRGATLQYVSRGGLKLEKAMQTFPLDLRGKICADIGASTGDSRIACCKTAQRRSMPWMLAMANWIGSCAMMSAWSVWSAPTHGI